MFFFQSKFTMPTVKTTYRGELRTQATHVQSGTEIITDAPTDNKGKGEAFSPTDLVATALGSCMMTIMGIVAQRDGIDLTGSDIEITKVMSSDQPRRIDRVELMMAMVSPEQLTPTVQATLERAAHTCPVALSLHPELVQAVQFSWAVMQEA